MSISSKVHDLGERIHAALDICTGLLEYGMHEFRGVHVFMYHRDKDERSRYVASRV